MWLLVRKKNQGIWQLPSSVFLQGHFRWHSSLEKYSGRELSSSECKKCWTTCFSKSKSSMHRQFYSHIDILNRTIILLFWPKNYFWLKPLSCNCDLATCHSNELQLKAHPTERVLMSWKNSILRSSSESAVVPISILGMRLPSGTPCLNNTVKMQGYDTDLPLMLLLHSLIPLIYSVTASTCKGYFNKPYWKLNW